MRTPFCLGLMVSAATYKWSRPKEQTARDEKRQDQNMAREHPAVTIKSAEGADASGMKLPQMTKAQISRPQFTLDETVSLLLWPLVVHSISSCCLFCRAIARRRWVWVGWAKHHCNCRTSALLFCAGSRVRFFGRHQSGPLR